MWIATPNPHHLPSDVTVANAPRGAAARAQDQSLQCWSKSFEWDQQVRSYLPRLGVQGGFRPYQREVINACLKGLDIFVRMPTGGGKSLCFQIPALVKPTVLVISPLVSLIQDQVSELRTMGVAATALGSGALDEDGGGRSEVYSQLEDGQLALLYVTPEMLGHSPKLQRVLQRLNEGGRLSRIVIDEAHCLSIWGSEFRESYLELKNLRRVYPNVPILACSATATDEIIASVRQHLSMHPNTAVFRTPLDRRNLEFEVRSKRKKGVLKEIADLIKERFAGKSGIVYCLSRRDCEQVQAGLSELGISAEVYHAQIAGHLRSEVQERWKRGQTRIIVATIAFGMGVNKRDVRFVIHHSMPKSLEGYYQEAGRAGRDGHHASCIVFYDYEDKKRHQNLMECHGDGNMTPAAKEKCLQRLLSMVEYCEERRRCRRDVIAGYFGCAGQAQCGSGPVFCDSCKQALPLVEMNCTREAAGCVQLLRAARQSRGGRGAAVTICSLKDGLLGSRQQRLAHWQALPGFGSLREWGEADVQRLLRRLVIGSILDEEVVTPGPGSAPMAIVAYLIEGRRSEELMQGRLHVKLWREVEGQAPMPAPQPAAPKARARSAQPAEVGRASAKAGPKAKSRPLSALQPRRRKARGQGDADEVGQVPAQAAWAPMPAQPPPAQQWASAPPQWPQPQGQGPQVMMAQPQQYPQATVQGLPQQQQQQQQLQHGHQYPQQHFGHTVTSHHIPQQPPHISQRPAPAELHWSQQQAPGVNSLQHPPPLHQAQGPQQQAFHPGMGPPLHQPASTGQLHPEHHSAAQGMQGHQGGTPQQFYPPQHQPLPVSVLQQTCGPQQQQHSAQHVPPAGPNPALQTLPQQVQQTRARAMLHPNLGKQPLAPSSERHEDPNSRWAQHLQPKMQQAVAWSGQPEMPTSLPPPPRMQSIQTHVPQEHSVAFSLMEQLQFQGGATGSSHTIDDIEDLDAPSFGGAIQHADGTLSGGPWRGSTVTDFEGPMKRARIEIEV